MTAYWVNTFRAVTDDAKLAAYADLAGPAIRAAGGRFLARGKAAAAFEQGVPERTTLIEFDSVEQAVAAYHSPAYQQALAALGDGAQRDIRIVEAIAGMDPWERIARWCAINAPKTHAAIREPAGWDALQAAQRNTAGWLWPNDVLAFYEWCDGCERTPDGYMFPRYRPLSLGEVVETWRILMAVHYPEATALMDLPEPTRGERFGQLASDVTSGDPTSAAQAGTEAGLFIPLWLPVAEDQSGTYLMVDRRRGPLFGCIVESDKVDGDFGAKRWSTFSALADEAATALERKAGFRVLAVGGRLTWDR